MIKFLIYLIFFILGFLACHTSHAAGRPTLGQCMAASAMAGAHNYEWQEKKFTREDCEAITEAAPKPVDAAPAAILQKPDPVEIHIHNPAPPAPVIIQKPAPTINIHIHNERSQPPVSATVDSCCLAAPGYTSRNGFYHHFHERSGDHNY
jgi:hypothetical protein